MTLALATILVAAGFTAGLPAGAWLSERFRVRPVRKGPPVGERHNVVRLLPLEEAARLSGGSE
jgi:uncharacterized protein YneF (UPF0154 family)